METRWQQRFGNFQQAFVRLKEAVEQPELNELERNGLIQHFEFTIDLAWKVMKDYLQDKGFSFKPSPKDIFRMAQEAGYINYARELIDGLEIRNELSHTYDERRFDASEAEIRQAVFPAMEKLHAFFKSEML